MTSEQKEQFCSPYIKVKLYDSLNHIGFLNRGGIANAGVCWWHSRLLRNATFMAYYSPAKKKPIVAYVLKTVSKGKKKNVPLKGSVMDILQRLKKAKKPVEIPGYANFNEFTKAHQKEVQKLLDNWQIEDGILKLSWVSGLKGKTKTTSKHLKTIMDKTYSKVLKGEVVFHKLQLEGISAHAWLVIGMREIPNGYRLDIVDSNFSGIINYYYQIGETSFYTSSYGNFVPYIENSKEFKKMTKNRSKVCQK